MPIIKSFVQIHTKKDVQRKNKEDKQVIITEVFTENEVKFFNYHFTSTEETHRNYFHL